MSLLRVLSPALGGVLACAALSTAPRSQPPRPLPAHPGNVFLAGESIQLRLPAAGRWHLRDYDGHALAQFDARNEPVALGTPPVGFYRLEPETAGNWVSLGVLAPLRQTTPKSSPIGLDVAMAWFYPPEQMDAVANLCALAGVNWVRDRLLWNSLEPNRDEFSGPDKYDHSLRAQTAAGLRTLQVIHLTPPWANPETRRFSLDLRDAHRFYAEMARRWRGQLTAFEPWNEADIDVFGGHTGAEIASLQKAAWLGMKSGNPDLIVCQNVFALHRAAQLADFHANEAWPYFDTFNLHHYESFEKYPQLYADFRSVSAGRPLWVSECALPVKWAGDDKLKEPTDGDLRVQAERVAKTFALSLHEGSRATFYFLLPHYSEGQTQFGILRPDLTPRPAYVALAAVGRLLADAHALGCVRTADMDTHAYLFNAAPDGHRRTVLVAWNGSGASQLHLPARAEAAFDHLGRALSVSDALPLTTAPVFAVLPAKARADFDIEPPPAPVSRLAGRVCPVVLQSLWPEKATSLEHSAYRISASNAVRVPVFAYNFGKQALRGRVRLEVPPDCAASFPMELALAPGERQELALTLPASATSRTKLSSARIVAEFSRDGRAVLALRLLPETKQP